VRFHIVVTTDTHGNIPRRSVLRIVRGSDGRVGGDVSERWIGIDFSGDHTKWSAGCSTSNVWVADVRRDEAAGFRLHDVRRVQQLAGSGGPFARLAKLLASGTFIAAAIDAPFSVPSQFVNRVGGHAGLVKLVGSSAPTGRSFLRGADMVQLIAGTPPPLNPKKPLRATERWWTDLGVNTRSTMWAGARGGAPMTAACLTLLHQAARPAWPWSSAPSGLLVEAFPAAQLRTWSLPHRQYDGSTALAIANRKRIVKTLSKLLHVGTWASTLLGSADALDAAVGAFAAIAIAKLDPVPNTAGSCAEGCIAIHP
jgi:hypothetical protein